MQVLHLTYREFPPSSNKIYWGLKKALTKTAVKYGEDFNKWMVQHHGHELMNIHPDHVYAVHLHFFFPTIVNSTWSDLPPKSSKKRAEDRYKRFDLDNRIKLLTDCVVDFVGVDDSHFLASSQEKHQDSSDPRIEIYIQEVDPKDFGA